MSRLLLFMCAVIVQGAFISPRSKNETQEVGKSGELSNSQTETVLISHDQANTEKLTTPSELKLVNSSKSFKPKPDSNTSSHHLKKFNSNEEYQSSDLDPVTIKVNDSSAAISPEVNFNNQLPRIPIFPGNMLFSPSMASRLANIRTKQSTNQQNMGKFRGPFRQPLSVSAGMQPPFLPNVLGMAGGRLLPQEFMNRPNNLFMGAMNFPRFNGIPPFLGRPPNIPMNMNMNFNPAMFNMQQMGMGLNGINPGFTDNLGSSLNTTSGSFSNNNPLFNSAQNSAVFGNPFNSNMAQFGNPLPGFTSNPSAGFTNNANFRIGVPNLMASDGSFSNGLGNIGMNNPLSSFGGMGLNSSFDFLSRPDMLRPSGNSLMANGMLANQLSAISSRPPVPLDFKNNTSGNFNNDILKSNGLVNPLFNLLPPMLNNGQLLRHPITGLPVGQNNLNFLMPHPLQANPLMTRAGQMPPSLMPPFNLLQSQLAMGQLGGRGILNLNSLNQLPASNLTFDVLSGGVFSGSNRDETIVRLNGPMQSLIDNHEKSKNNDFHLNTNNEEDNEANKNLRNKENDNLTTTTSLSNENKSVTLTSIDELLTPKQTTSNH